MFTRRLDPVGSDRALCANGYNCPAILEMESGDFAVIGSDITASAAEKMLPGCGCGPEERVVRIPRATLMSARQNIPLAS